MAASPSDASTPVNPGPWAPLRVPTFRWLWLAILFSNIGTGVQEVAAAWIMTEKTQSPLLVAAVQSATTLPVVLLALFAGTAADLIDRRRYLIAAQCVSFIAAATATVLSILGLMTPWALLACVFIGGVGAALAMPAQAATNAELVPRSMLPAAVSLGSLGMNIARSVGPALGGVIVAVLGASWAFGFNAISFLGVIAVLWLWRRAPVASTLPAEHFGSAMRAGVRYAFRSPPFRAVLLRAAGFFAFASAFTALMPLLARGPLALGAGGFGTLLATVGVGAILGALALPVLRSRLGGDRLVLGASITYGAVLIMFAMVPRADVAYAAAFVGGLAWICVLASFQVAAQTRVPGWVRARALSLYILVFSGGMAAGSLVWGAIAQLWGIETAYLLAGVGLLTSSVVSARFRIADQDPDVMPSSHWPQPSVMESIHGERGPVLIIIEYRLLPDRLAEAVTLLRELGRRRRRDGSLQWAVYEDTAQPDVVLESFLDASWLDHLRLHERVTGEEKRLQESIQALLAPGTRPVVRHFVGAEPGRPIAPDRSAQAVTPTPVR